MTEVELIRIALERGGSVGPSAAETLAKSEMPAVTCPKQLTEKQFMGEVIKLATSLGWKVYHTYDSRRSEPGFPDLLLVRERVIFAELKAENGEQTKAQFGWEKALLDAGAECYCWWPRDWAEIVRILTPGARMA